MYALRTSIGPWSAGTRVTMLDEVGTDPIVRAAVGDDQFEVEVASLVKLRKRSTTVPANAGEKKRLKKAARRIANASSGK